MFRAVTGGAACEASWGKKQEEARRACRPGWGSDIGSPKSVKGEGGRKGVG